MRRCAPWRTAARGGMSFSDMPPRFCVADAFAAASQNVYTSYCFFAAVPLLLLPFSFLLPALPFSARLRPPVSVCLHYPPQSIGIDSSACPLPPLSLRSLSLPPLPLRPLPLRPLPLRPPSLRPPSFRSLLLRRGSTALQFLLHRCDGRRLC